MDEPVNVSEAWAQLKAAGVPVSRRSLYEACKSGRIAAIQPLGPGSMYFLNPADFLAKSERCSDESNDE